MKKQMVENWLFLCEERVTVNRKWKSGFVKRFFVDPAHKLGLGSTVSAFYGDESELLLAAHWKVGTREAFEANRIPGGKWTINGPMTKPPPYPLSIREELTKFVQQYRTKAGKKRVSLKELNVSHDIEEKPFLTVCFDKPTASLENLKKPA